ncbi:unnamed protein product [Rotaria magnacalcarata]|uniref:CCHC-type domain-containing protein n=1 Tax=Rotaria magnacalcarata TaxID=392030 RepID=A0A816U4L0_9BILA|nr:unnamed protein product [Rotaria magnacalcarata]
MDLNIESMDGKVREVLQCLVHSIRLLTAENKATNACMEAMKINLTALQGNVVRGNITEPTPYIQTKNFRRAFSALTRNKGESLLTLSVRVSELARQAYPTFREVEFKELIKNKFLEVIPNALEDFLEFAFAKVDMGKIRLAKIVELAEGCEKQISEATKGETIKPDIIIETKLASALDNVTSLRPNGGAVLKLKCNICNRFGHTSDTCVSSNVNISLKNSNKVDIRVDKSNRSILNRRCYSCRNFGHLAHACKKGPNNNNLPGNVPHYFLSTNKCCGCGDDLTINFHVWDDCPAVLYKRQIDMASDLGNRQDAIDVYTNCEIKPKADCITETISNFNLDYSLVNKAEMYADEIEPRAAHIKETFSDFNLNYSETNKTVSDLDDQYNETIVIADLFRYNEYNDINDDAKPKAENVRLATEAEVVIQSNNENIKINVPNNNLEPLDVSFDIAVPFIELVQPENVKVNFEESELGPKAESIEEANCKNKLRPNGIEETKTNLNLQPGKNNKIEITCINIKDEAEEVKGTDVNINLSPDEDIKVKVPEINKELIYENLKVRFPDMFLEPFESVKVNFEKIIIAAQNLKRKEDIKTPSAMNVEDNCKSEIECNTKIKINDQKCKLLPNAESAKQTQTKSTKFDKSCKANSANNNIEPPTCILVESDESKVRNNAVDVVKNILKSDISGNKKRKVNNKNSNLQPKATGIVETRSKSHSNKNVNLNCSKLVIKPKASDVNNKSKLIVQDNKKVKLDDKNIKLKPKAKNVHINEISKVKITYDRVEPKAESWEDILAEFNLQCDKDNGIKITNDKVKPKAVDVKDNSKSNISAGQIVKVNYESSNVKPRAEEFEEDNISMQLDVSENIDYNEGPFTLDDEGPFTLDDEGPFTLDDEDLHRPMFDDGTFALY